MIIITIIIQLIKHDKHNNTSYIIISNIDNNFSIIINDNNNNININNNNNSFSRVRRGSAWEPGAGAKNFVLEIYRYYR